MKLSYQAPETTIVFVNGQKDLLQTEVYGASKEGKWGDGSNTSNFEEEESFETAIQAPNLWEE